MKRIDPLQYLRRSDKWYLGGGGRLLWAPPFPHYLDSPGFWDGAQYFNFDVQPLFTWTLLDGEGKEIPLTFRKRSWTPAVLMQEYSARGIPGLLIREQKSVLPNDVAACTISMKNRSRRRLKLHIVLWSAQETAHTGHSGSISNIAYSGGRISFAKQFRTGDRPGFQYAVALAMEKGAHSYAIQGSETAPVSPRWEHTPFYEMFNGGSLPSIARPGIPEAGTTYCALHRTLSLPSRETRSINIGMAVGSDALEAAQNLSRILTSSPIALSEMVWREYFDTVPYFECDDTYLTRYYWYRWYGLRLNTICASEGNYSNPFVCEGIGYFRAPISYSAPCHILENRWQHTPALARGSMLTFIDNQRSDGGFRGYIDRHFYREEMFYHAMWGNALMELERIHPSTGFLQEAYNALKKYAQYFDRERDPEVSGLYDIDNHYETGQEYMSRYMVVNRESDKDHWGKVFRLKGVDVTVYIYDLKRALAQAARRLGMTDEVDLWNLEAERTKAAILGTMWDPEDEMFYDVDPSTGKRTGVKAAVCFYPYFTDIVSENHLAGLKRHLLNKREFWTPYPVPSSAVSDPMFSSGPLWKETRMNCPWNGRVWPMANSHIAESLARPAIRFNDRMLKEKTAAFIRSFIEMMFFDGDPDRPNCFEHYNPVSGKPSLYRGIDDYQHSWVVDLIMKYVCGIRPGDGRIIIDPFPFGLKRLLIEGVVVGSTRLGVMIDGGTLTVLVGGKPVSRARLGTPVVLLDENESSRNQ